MHATTEPACAARGPLLLGLLTLALLVGGLGGWSILARVASAVVARGVVAVEGNRQVVEHASGGVLAAIAVRDGDRVAAGDLLLRFEGERTRADLAIVEGQLLELLAEKARLEAERDGRSALAPDPELAAAAAEPAAAAALAAETAQFAARRDAFEEELARLDERRAQILHQIDGLAAQDRSVETQLAVLAREIETQEALFARGLAVQSRLLLPLRERARLEGAAGQVAAQRAESRARIAEIEIERLRLGTGRREEAMAGLRALARREIELRARRGQLRDEAERLELRAPVAGVVYGSRADSLAAVMRPAEPIMFIVPDAAPLIVRLSVAPTDIDAVHPGQPARLRFPVFGARRTPELEGTVRAISADVFLDEASGAAYYRVDVTIPPAERARLDRALLPGMPVEALLTADSRAPLDYFVRPLLDYFERALREG